MGKNEREPTVTKIKNGRGYNITDREGNSFRVKGSRAKAEDVANAGWIRRKARNIVK